MTHPLTPMEILQLLNKSNCRECGESTCMAFAAAVFRGDRRLSECPYLDALTVSQYGNEDDLDTVPKTQEEQDRQVQLLQKDVSGLDLYETAKRLGGEYIHHSLKIQMLGKPVYVFEDGRITSDIHLNSWVVLPLLQHILYGSGLYPSGKWIPFRELSGGMSWNGLFQQRSQKPLKKLFDNSPDLFEDVLAIFKGQRVDNQFGADIGAILYPLPRVPILLSYRKPEEEFESSLHIFFDQTVEENVSIEGIFALCTGLVRMFERIAWHHGGTHEGE